MKERIPQLDGLRAVAVIGVFLVHATSIRLVWIGVDLFFVLSGFLITGILIQSKDRSFGSYIRGFYARRVRRILPAYVAILVVTTLLFGTAWMVDWYFYVGGMNLLRPLGRDLGPPNIRSLWSLAVEEQFYLLWPIVVFFLDRKQIIRCAILLLALAPFLRLVCTPLFPDDHWVIYSQLPFRMDTLAAGALVALTKDRLSRRNMITAATLVLFAGLTGIYWLGAHGLSSASNTKVSNVFVYEATLFVVTGMFVLALVGVGKSVLSFAPIRWLGIISYSVYLFHVTAIDLSRGRIWVSVLIILAYAVPMWFLVERPILNFKKVRAVPHPISP